MPTTLTGTADLLSVSCPLSQALRAGSQDSNGDSVAFCVPRHTQGRYISVDVPPLGNIGPMYGSALADAQLLQDELLDAGRVGLAAGGLHDGAHEGTGRGDLAAPGLVRDGRVAGGGPADRG